MKGILALTMAGWLFGCSTVPTANPVNSDELAVVCVREVQLGSNLPRKVCRTKRSIDEEQRAAREDLEKVMQQDPGHFRISQ
jgi:hypothetical protein